MKLTDLNPRWLCHGGEGVFDKDDKEIPFREIIGVTFNCPCGKEHCGISIVFKNPADGGPAVDSNERATWIRKGDTFETLTLEPSIIKRKEWGGCGWHGYVTNGAINTLPDSFK